MTAGKQKNMVVKMVQRILDRQFYVWKTRCEVGMGISGKCNGEGSGSTSLIAWESGGGVLRGVLTGNIWGTGLGGSYVTQLHIRPSFPRKKGPRGRVLRPRIKSKIIGME